LIYAIIAPLCLSIHEYISKTECLNFTKFSVHVVCGLVLDAPQSSGGVAIRYVFPVFWMMLYICLHTRARNHLWREEPRTLNIPWEF